MPSYPKHQAAISIILLLILLAWNGGGNHDVVEAFSQSSNNTPRHTSVHASSMQPLLATEGFAPVQERPTTTTTDDTKSKKEIDTNNLSVDEVKSRLVDLIPRMTGNEEEYRAVESYVNLLEEKYSPVQTIDFLNLAMMGEWQLLFSTNLIGNSSPSRKLRLREMVQKIEPNKFNGTVINMAQWDYAEDTDGDDEQQQRFNSNGNFNIKCSYSINQGARMVMDLNEHEIRPAKGSAIPKDVPGLVGLLHRAIPTEIFDPNGHAMDTTYLDADLRIVRLTGPNHEGVRNIFMRKGALEISPM